MPPKRRPHASAPPPRRSCKAELDRLKFVATQTRKADESESRRATDQIKQLEGELARVHAQAEERQAAQLEELRAQMAEMREAAAQQARTAAAEAVASEVARAAAQSNDATPRKPNVVRMQPRAGGAGAAGQSRSPRARSRKSQRLRTPRPAVVAIGRLLQPLSADGRAGRSRSKKRRKKSGRRDRLPAPREVGASCRRVPAARHQGTGTAISTVTRFVTPAEKPALIVQPVNPDPFIEVVEQRVGSLKIESTPDGAEAIVDGTQLRQRRR